MKITILNLARSITKEELKALFEEYGTVQSCDLVLNESTGESKGFGFVEMSKAEEAILAIESLNKKKIAKSRIRVKNAEEKEV